MDRRQLLGAALALASGWARALEEGTGTWVAAMRRGPVFTIDAVVVVAVAPRVAWDVLVDFVTWPAFVPNMTSSRVVSREGEVLRVEQRGDLKWGPAIVPFATVRDVQLKPYESMQSTSVAEATPLEQSLTRFKPVPAGTEIWHHAEVVLNTWMPDRLAEIFLQNVMQERFEAIAAEMVRRGALAAR